MSAFNEAFESVMVPWAREILTGEVARVLSKDKLGFATDDERHRAAEIVAKVEAEGKLFEILEATAPKPCPECGR